MSIATTEDIKTCIKITAKNQITEKVLAEKRILLTYSFCTLTNPYNSHFCYLKITTAGYTTECHIWTAGSEDVSYRDFTTLTAAKKSLVIGHWVH